MTVYEIALWAAPAVGRWLSLRPEVWARLRRRAAAAPGEASG